MVALRRFSWLVLTLLTVQGLEACISDTGGSDINPQPLPPGQSGEEGSSSGDDKANEPGAIGADAGGGRQDDASDGGDGGDAPHEATDGGDAG